MPQDKSLLNEFISGTTEVSWEIRKLLEKLPSDSSAKKGSPLLAIHKLITNLAKSAKFIELEYAGNFLTAADSVIIAIKDKRLPADNLLVSAMKKLFTEFTAVVNKTDETGLEDIISLHGLIDTANDIENGIFADAPTEKMPVIDEDLLPDFIADTEEHIASAEENFLLLLHDGFNQEVVNTTFRNIHSIKGNCGFVHLFRLQDLLHAMETIVGEMRGKTIVVNNENISYLLKLLDVVKQTVGKLESGGNGVILNLKKLLFEAENKFPEAFGIEQTEQAEPEPIEEQAEPEPIPEPTPEPIAEEIPEPIAEPVAEPVAEPAEAVEAPAPIFVDFPDDAVEDKADEILAKVDAETNTFNLEDTGKQLENIFAQIETEGFVDEQGDISSEVMPDFSNVSEKCNSEILAEKTEQKIEEKIEPEPIEEKIEPKVEEKVMAKVEKAEEKKAEPAAKKTAAKAAPVIKNSSQIKEEIDRIVVSDDMRQNFSSDSNEQLNAAEEAFLLLDKEGFDQETMDYSYRQIHSFKGNCGFMQLDDLKAVSHTMETVMQFMRDKRIAVDNKSISFLLNFLDVLRCGVKALEKGENTDIPELESYQKRAAEEFPECFPSYKATAAVAQKSKKIDKVEKVQADDDVMLQNLSLDLPSPSGGSKSNSKIVRRQDLRVDLEKLEKIIDLAGELVIAESMVSRNPAVEALANEGLSRSIYRLRRICNELQDATMSLRMVPLAGLFKKMSRLVHDLSNHVEKKINLVTEGEDTEVDKTVFELINDPLVHIIRNACDHGIGTPKERLSLGKKENGTITISGEHRGGAVWITIKDDGRGLQREKILGKAIEQGLVSPDAQLTDDEVWQLIFKPGFSTASVVSDISGRGVGMDVVLKNIESINGQIFVKTVPGKGSEFIIRIPLTLAIIDGMIIKAADSLYIIPTLSIKQSLKFEKEQITYSPEQEEILKFQEKLVPVVRVGNLFGKKEEITENGILIVVEEDNSLTALYVDDIVGQQQIVIKGLSEYISKSRGTSGCTILGDGSVALILDIKTLADMAMDKASNTQKIPSALIKKRSENGN